MIAAPAARHSRSHQRTGMSAVEIKKMVLIWIGSKAKLVDFALSKTGLIAVKN
jgi:hypothetical protein